MLFVVFLAVHDAERTAHLARVALSKIPKMPTCGINFLLHFLLPLCLLPLSGGLLFEYERTALSAAFLFLFLFSTLWWDSLSCKLYVVLFGGGQFGRVRM